MDRISSTARSTLTSETSEDKAAIKYRRVLSYIKRQLKLHQNGSVLFNLKAGRIGLEGATIIADYLANNPTLTELTFYRTRLKDEAALDLVHILENNSTLTKLTLNRTSFNSASFKSIAQSLTKHKAIRFLSFSDNNINNNIVLSISDLLKCNTTLTHLDLSNNSICDESAINIAEALRFNSTLTELNLFNNYIQDRGAISIAETLKANNTLVKINLCKNIILSRGVKQLANALLMNQTLTELKISINIINTHNFVEPIQEFKKTIANIDFYPSKNSSNLYDIENVNCLHFNEDSESDAMTTIIVNKDNGVFLQSYLSILSICNRNRLKELLIARATPVLQVLAPDTPREIADLIAKQLLITENDAQTLRRLGDLI